MTLKPVNNSTQWEKQFQYIPEAFPPAAKALSEGWNVIIMHNSNDSKYLRKVIFPQFNQETRLKIINAMINATRKEKNFYYIEIDNGKTMLVFHALGDNKN